jgi:hypothetical protein
MGDLHPKDWEIYMLHFMTSLSAFQDVAMDSYNLLTLSEGYAA